MPRMFVTRLIIQSPDRTRGLGLLHWSLYLVFLPQLPQPNFMFIHRFREVTYRRLIPIAPLQFHFERQLPEAELR